MPRYRGKIAKVKVLHDGKPVTLDSKLEARTYKKVREKYRNYQILIHHPIVISPKNNWFSRQRWKPDFILCDRGKIGQIIEAKGVFDNAFKKTLILLSNHRPDLVPRLTIVHYPSAMIPKWARQFNLVTIDEY